MTVLDRVHRGRDVAADEREDRGDDVVDRRPDGAPHGVRAVHLLGDEREYPAEHGVDAVLDRLQGCDDERADDGEHVDDEVSYPGEDRRGGRADAGPHAGQERGDRRPCAGDAAADRLP